MHRVQDHMTDFESLDLEHEMLLAPQRRLSFGTNGYPHPPKSTDQEGSGNPEQRTPPFRRSDAVMHSAEDKFP